VETLEGRILRAGPSPSNPVPVSPGPIGSPTPQQLGAAYHQVGAIETTTLHALGAAARDLEAAGAQLASQAAVAINGLTTQLKRVQLQQQADARAGDRAALLRDQAQEGALAAAIHRDRHLVNLGAAHAARVNHALDVARGVEAQATTADQIDIPNRVFMSLQQLVDQATTLGATLARQGQHQAATVIAKLNHLGDRLEEAPPGGT
jgi:hypothetical protein